MLNLQPLRHISTLPVSDRIAASRQHQMHSRMIKTEYQVNYGGFVFNRFR